MSFQGQWLGQWPGQWFGPVEVEPGSMSANLTGSGGISGTLTGQSSADGAGGRFQYPNWQPYLMARRDWEKKIAPVVVQTIERIARADKPLERSLRVLEEELDVEAAELARYQQLLAALMQSQYNSLQALRRAQIERIRQDEEEEELLLMV